MPKKIPKCGAGLERGKRISTILVREEEGVKKKDKRERERETSREILEITNMACALSSFASLSANAMLIIYRPIIIISGKITIIKMASNEKPIDFLL